MTGVQTCALPIFKGEPALGAYDAVIVAVGHAKFLEKGPEGIRQYGKPEMVFYDVKSLFPLGTADGRL